MRLIDADALIGFIDLGHLRHPGELAFSELDVVNMLNHAPTAYDVDEVVKRLEEELRLADKEKGRCARENPLQFDSAKGYASGIAVAIEIVKGGGAIKAFPGQPAEESVVYKDFMKRSRN